jgi:inner membrane protein
MPSAFTHAAAAIAITACFAKPGTSKALWIAGAAGAIAPDLDAIGFWAGVPYESMFGHRGISHSLFAAALGAAILTWGLGKKRAAIRVAPTVPAMAVCLFLCIASHGILDAFTNGGLGIAFFSPFHNARYFFPFTPIAVAPISITGFFTQRGLHVFASEFLWVWIPAAALTAIALMARRRPVAPA